MFNFSKTGYFPYPFLNEMKNWRIVPGFLIGMAVVGSGLAYGSSSLIHWTKCGGGEEDSFLVSMFGAKEL